LVGWIGADRSGFCLPPEDLNSDLLISSVGRARAYSNVGGMFPGFRFGLFRDYAFCSSMCVSVFVISPDVACFRFFLLLKELFPASKEVMFAIR